MVTKLFISSSSSTLRLLFFFTVVLKEPSTPCRFRGSSSLSHYWDERSGCFRTRTRRKQTNKKTMNKRERISVLAHKPRKLCCPYSNVIFYTSSIMFHTVQLCILFLCWSRDRLFWVTWYDSGCTLYTGKFGRVYDIRCSSDSTRSYLEQWFPTFLQPSTTFSTSYRF